MKLNVTAWAAPLAAAMILSGCEFQRAPTLACALSETMNTDLSVVGQSATDPTELGTGPAETMIELDATNSMLGALRARVAQAPPAGPRRVASLPPVTFQVLSLSAGGQFGAFGAGFLRGWAENPASPRPRFDLVTGVSAGAFLSPVAFVGQGHEEKLDVYRGLREDQVLKRRPLYALLNSPSLATVTPLEALIRSQVDKALIDDVAERHRDGARLLISAVNLDTTRQTVFDLGAIANAPLSDQMKQNCMTEAMLASAAIPGLFPPRNIDGALFVDGGVRDQVFLAAIEDARRQVAAETGRPIRVEAVIVINGSLRPPEKSVKDSLLSYIERSVITLGDEVLRDSIAETIAFAQGRPNWAVRGVYAETDLSACGTELPAGTFDPCITEKLFDDGRRASQAAPINYLSAEELAALAGEF